MSVARVIPSQRSERGFPLRPRRAAHSPARSARAPRSRRAFEMSWHRGLTLLEVVVCLALMSMLMGALLTFFWQSATVRAQVVAASDRTELARQVLDRMATELRGCLGVEQFGFPVEQRLAGDRRSVTFVTTGLPGPELYQFYGEFDELPPGQHDLRELRYSLWVDPEKTKDSGDPLVAGILRDEKKTLNQLVIDEEEPLQIRHDLWASELVYLEFRYFDGVEWTTKWDVTQGNALPQLVQITVGFEPLTKQELQDEDLTTWPLDQYPLGDELPHPDRYTAMVRMPAADRFFSSRLERMGQQFSDQLGVEGKGLK